VVRRLERDGFFRLYAGRTAMSGEVADTTTTPSAQRDKIWGYGQIGFGQVPGELPIVSPKEIPGAWGAAVPVTLR
jgi:hypothetical protein